MANPGRPTVKRATSNATFSQVRRPEISNSNRSSVGISYPLFFFGTFIIAAVIYGYRALTKDGEYTQSVSVTGEDYSFTQNVNRNRIVRGIGLFLKPDANADISRAENLTQTVDAINSGKFQPRGSVYGTG